MLLCYNNVCVCLVCYNNMCVWLVCYNNNVCVCWCVITICVYALVCYNNMCVCCCFWCTTLWRVSLCYCVLWLLMVGVVVYAPLHLRRAITSRSPAHVWPWLAERMAGGDQWYGLLCTNATGASLKLLQEQRRQQSRIKYAILATPSAFFFYFLVAEHLAQFVNAPSSCCAHMSSNALDQPSEYYNTR